MEQNQPKARVLAYYLPQFHPIPENDEWWGKGFTEWTNVGKAKPLFPGHYQPHVPADLGYYDLRVPETREAQAQLAREYGVEGFVYWHYWFGNGKRLLERPFNEVLASGKPDFPFALAWANETWQGFWFGDDGSRNVLIEQTYPGDEDYIAHFNTVLPAFKDKRYITCNGKPVFFIYRPKQLPNVEHFIDLWQGLAKDNGLQGICFIAIAQNFQKIDVAEKELADILNKGFNSLNVINAYDWPITSIKYRIVRKVLFKKMKVIPDVRPYCYEQFACPIDNYDNVIPTILPNWDHTPRTGSRGIVLCGSTPELFRECLHKKIELIKDKPFDQRFLMIKSWNEWAEGNYLEPDLKFGCRYLEAIKSEVYC
jgi:hypothetical protein